MANRAERRRQARRLGKAAEDLGRSRVTGILTETGFADTGSAGALPDKVPGRHRWVCLASYVLSDAMVANELRRQAGDPGPDTVLDHETRFALSIGCWDCEQALGEITPDTTCPAPGGPE